MNTHQHQYIIPVEWAYEYTEWSTPVKNGTSHFGDGITAKKVTVLRCTCGEEVTR